LHFQFSRMFAGQCRCLCFRHSFSITGFFAFPVLMNVCRSVSQPLLQAHIQHHRFLCISSVNECLPVSVAAFASGTHSESPVSFHFQSSWMFAGQCRCLCFRHSFNITSFFAFPVFTNVCWSVTQPLLQAHIQHHSFSFHFQCSWMLPVCKQYKLHSKIWSLNSQSLKRATNSIIQLLTELN